MEDCQQLRGKTSAEILTSFYTLILFAGNSQVFCVRLYGVSVQSEGQLAARQENDQSHNF